MNLYAHHSHERDVAINTLLEAALRGYFNPQGFDAEARKHTIPAITHPLLTDGKNRETMLYVLRCRWTGMSKLRVYDPDDRLFPPLASEGTGMLPNCILEIQQFLRDPRRSGSYYVDRGMYAALSLRIAKIIFEPNRSVRVITFPDLNLFLTLISLDIERIRPTINQVLQLAVDTLPFYVSNADYTSELAGYFLNHTLDPETLEDFYPNIQPVQDAIDLYLKVNLASIIICFILTLSVDQRKPRVKESRPHDDLPELSRKRQRC